VLYREGAGTDAIVHNSEPIRRYRRTFEQAWQQSLSPSSTSRLITAQVALRLASMERDRG
jgi:hypothetical protein